MNSIAIGLESKMAKFYDFLKPAGLKAGVLKVSGLGWDRAPRALYCSWRETDKQPTDKLHGNSNLKNTWAHSEEVICSYQSIAQTDSIQRETSPETN